MKRVAITPLLALVLLVACTSLPQHPDKDKVLPDDAQVTLFVARRGWHIDIGFRVEDLLPPLSSVIPVFAGARYLFFGFGDRHYLLAAHKSFPGIFAALWPGAGMLLVTALAQHPEEGFGAEHVIRLRISRAAAQAAQSFVWNSLLKDNGAPIFYARGPYEGSQFLSAVPQYSAAYTCNTWAAQALQTAGVPIKSRGVVFAWQLWSQLLRARAQSADEQTAVIPDAPLARR